MSSLAAAGVREGELLAGKYRIEGVLGKGGMGVVIAAHHVDLDQRVAIKFLLPEVLDNREVVMRFAREARAAVRIHSEHVARVADVGKLDNGAPYMVMEYLDGSDLAGWLRAQGPLPLEQAAEFVLQACEAIAEAHALGIVHRDLKPSNLFVIRRPDGLLSVKVLDFGISKSTGSTTGQVASMTQTAGLIGSPLYMSPEQLQSPTEVDARTDIWALGVILHELVANKPPFTGQTMPELVLRIANQDAPPLRQHRPDVSPGFEQVVLRCLAKDPAARFESVADLAVALLPFAPRRSRGSVDRISGVLRGAGFVDTALAAQVSSAVNDTRADAGTNGSWGKTTRTRGRRRRFAVLAAALALAAGLTVWRATRQPDLGVARITASGGRPAVTVSRQVAPAAPTAAEPSGTKPEPAGARAALAPLGSAPPVDAPATPERVLDVGNPAASGKPASSTAKVARRPSSHAPRSAPEQVNIFDERK
jgi:serine/threonine-protein kinase